MSEVKVSGWILSWGLRGRICSMLFPSSMVAGILGVPWLVDISLQPLTLLSRGILPACQCSKFPLISISVIDLGSTLIQCDFILP